MQISVEPAKIRQPIGKYEHFTVNQKYKTYCIQYQVLTNDRLLPLSYCTAH